MNSAANYGLCDDHRDAIAHRRDCLEPHHDEWQRHRNLDVGYTTWRCTDCGQILVLPPECEFCSDSGRQEYNVGPCADWRWCDCRAGKRERAAVAEARAEAAIAAWEEARR